MSAGSELIVPHVVTGQRLAAYKLLHAYVLRTLAQRGKMFSFWLVCAEEEGHCDRALFNGVGLNTSGNISNDFPT